MREVKGMSDLRLTRRTPVSALQDLLALLVAWKAGTDLRRHEKDRSYAEY
jgi:hypothetical protein